MTTLEGTPENIPVTISVRTATLIAEVLEHAETFLRHASPTVRAELRTYLDEHTTADPGWLVDMLGFQSLFLQAKVTLAAEPDHAGQEIWS